MKHLVNSSTKESGCLQITKPNDKKIKKEIKILELLMREGSKGTRSELCDSHLNAWARKAMSLDEEWMEYIKQRVDGLSEQQIMPFFDKLVRFHQDELRVNSARIFHTIAEVRKYFWINYKINHYDFDILFIGVIREGFRNYKLRVYGSPTGSYPEKDYIEIPSKYIGISNGCIKKIYALWGIDTR